MPAWCCLVISCGDGNWCNNVGSTKKNGHKAVSHLKPRVHVHACMQQELHLLLIAALTCRGQARTRGAVVVFLQRQVRGHTKGPATDGCPFREILGEILARSSLGIAPLADTPVVTCESRLT